MPSLALPKLQPARRTAFLFLGAVLFVLMLVTVRAATGASALVLLEWIRGAGIAGTVVFFFAYAAGVALLVPGTLLGLSTGFVFGPVWGATVAVPAGVLGATAGFLLGRTVLRAPALAAMERYRLFDAAVRALDRDGFRIMLLLRFSVLPFGLLNYALGATRVPVRTYVLTTFLGTLPAVLLFAYAGSALETAAQLVAAEGAGAGTFGHALYWVGLATTALLVPVVSRAARRALDESVGERAG